MLDRLIQTHTPRVVILIRLMVALVFLSEGVQKFLFPEIRGTGRFIGIGLPVPERLAYFVACVEITAGALLVVGLMTRTSAAALSIIMIVAMITTKIPVLLGHGYWGLNVRELSQYGFWSMAHVSCTDFAMLIGLALSDRDGGPAHSMPSGADGVGGPGKLFVRRMRLKALMRLF